MKDQTGKPIGCPTPMSCHRRPQCQDGCEDPESVAAYKADIRRKAAAKLEEVRTVLDLYHNGHMSGADADEALLNLILRKPH